MLAIAALAPASPTAAQEISLSDAVRQAVDANLDLAGAILQLDETRLTHDALHHHAPGNGKILIHRFQCFAFGIRKSSV